MGRNIQTILSADNMMPAYSAALVCFYRRGATYGTGIGIGNGNRIFLPPWRRRAAMMAFFIIFFFPASTPVCWLLNRPTKSTRLIIVATVKILNDCMMCVCYVDEVDFCDLIAGGSAILVSVQSAYLTCRYMMV